MKKFLALLVALMLTLSLASTAFAATGSKTTNDLNNAEATTTTEEEPEDETEKSVIAELSSDPEKIAKANDELAKLGEAENVAEYFGQAEEITEILGEGNYNVFEFWPLSIYNYEPSMSDVALTFKFATPYEAGTKVAVLIGIVDAEGAVEWTAFEGEALEDGSVKVTLDAETLVKIQNNTALIAIVSK